MDAKIKFKVFLIFFFLFLLFGSPPMFEFLLMKLGDINYSEGRITQIQNVNSEEKRIFYEFKINGKNYSGENKFLKINLPELHLGDIVYIYYGNWWPSLLHELDAYLMKNIDRKEDIMEQRRNGDIYIISHW